MLGGGSFVAKNKTLPGSYINFVNASTAGSTVGERGVVAIALPLNKSAGNVIEITNVEFASKCEELLGKKADSAEMLPLREIFCHARKVLVYDLGGDKNETDALSAFEAYDFNVICAYCSDVINYVNTVKTWRDELGKKCQLIIADDVYTPDNEGVINVVSNVADNGGILNLAAWVAGAEAGCKINESCTNMLYDGELTIVVDKTQKQLEDCIKAGQIAFHLVYGEVRLLEDVNTLTTVSDEKGEDFKYNQTIRVIDQVANDLAKLFNTKYLGKIPNNASGRVALWGDIVKHHRELEAIGAIENFDATLVTVEQGDSKKSIVVNDAITVTNAMAQLYMTVVVQ